MRLITAGIAAVQVMLLAFSTAAFAAQINVATDRNPVSLDESFRIIFTANETPDDDPDFSPLEQDFEILGQTSSSNTSWINGKSSKTIQWTLTVMAKQAGNLNIPPVKFGDDTSEAATILVTKGAANQSINSNEDLFLEIDAAPTSPYVQSQVLYTLKLYTRVDIAQAKLNEPELDDAVIEKLGDDSNYNTQVNGVNYSVTERKYAIFPQKSGRMAIKPLVLTAEVLTNMSRPGFSGFFSPQITRTKRVESKEITLNVLPVPAEFTGHHWLSAEELHLQQEWSGDNRHMKVGEPLTRTLSLLAKGATVGQLPELNSAKLDGPLKAYPDQPALQEQKKPDGLIAFREEKIALIPSKAGQYRLPAIEIPWFNTRSRKMEIARIPETEIAVIAAAATPAAPRAPENQPDMPPKSESVAPNPPARQYNVWPWVSLFLAFGWLTTLIYFLTRRPVLQPIRDVSIGEAPKTGAADYVKNLKKACHENDADAAKNSLIDWGRHQFNASSLGTLATFCDTRLRDEILTLNQILYGKNSAQWNGKKLLQAFSEHKARKKIAPAGNSGLEPLFRL